jgi:DNA-directed RNA polymerase specialized sigma24 family protein
MANARLRIEPQRDLLSQAIVESLQSWPEYYRRVFIEIHYCGRPVEDVARSLGLQTVAVKLILERCEIMLHQALKVFRAGSVEHNPTAHSYLAARASNSCHL